MTKKTFNSILCLALLTLSPCVANSEPGSQTGKVSKLWQSTRLSSLKQYRDGKSNAALSLLNKALAEAKKNNDKTLQVQSLCDLAVFYELQHNGDEALKFYEKAATLNGELATGDNEITNYLVANYAYLLRRMGKADEAKALESKFGGESANTIGSATMTKDYTIDLYLTVQEHGMSGRGHLTYKVTNPRYDEILLHLGLFKPDENKVVTPWINKG